MVIALLSSVSSFAYDVQVNGINYNIKKSQWAAVTTSSCSGSVTIPDAISYNGESFPVKEIEKSAFYNCKQLTSINLPNTITTIGNSAFEYCYKLASIVIPNSVTKIEDYTFLHCEELASVTLPAALTEIGDNAFKRCYKLSSITIPDNVTTIGKYAFDECKALTKIVIPANVSTINDSPFIRCTSLRSIIVSEENKTFDSRNNCNAIINTSTNTLVIGCNGSTVPSSVEYIGGYAFHGTELTSITLPNVRHIYTTAFAGCKKLKTVTLGKSVSYLSAYAFSGCSNLEDVYCLNENVPEVEQWIGEYTQFQGCDVEYVTLHVPTESLEAYKTAVMWKEFGTIVALTEADGIESVNTTKQKDLIYDLSGRRLAEPKSGVNIINGKKILIK